MDPDATVKDILDALDKEDMKKAEEHAEYLYAWVRMGGFKPKVEGPVLARIVYALPHLRWCIVKK